MAIKAKTVASKKKQPAGSETSLAIEEKTKAFLESGGEIQQISSGVSGQQSMTAPKPAVSKEQTVQPKEQDGSVPVASDKS
ncbi:hypothetical protein A9Q81_23810 [Gammaproteobacteria bacterium 42_54_T18]|nr:hypothetical protein A9Q81_23810 [Gammaproteobacteria bacterium 42_54_T18]